MKSFIISYAFNISFKKSIKMWSRNYYKTFKSVLRHYSSVKELTKIKIDNNVKTITMCDLKTRNSLSIAMMQNIEESIKNEFNNTELRAIVIAAEGNVFSAGHNLKELSKDCDQQQILKVFSLASKLMNTIIDAPVPIIAKVDGLAAAAGCQLVAQCDIAICSTNSKFSTPGANFGLFCSTPGVALARTIQKMTAMHMLLTGLPISSEEALRSGLVSKIVLDTNLDSEIEIICEAIKEKSRAVIELGKRFYYQQIKVDIKQAYELGGRKMVDNLRTKDGQEGIQSFIEKRKPVWNHAN